MTQNLGQNMLLISSTFLNEDSFKLIPLTQDCPYLEVVYSPSLTILAIVSKTMTEKFSMVPRLDDNGNPQRVAGHAANAQNPYKEQRITTSMPYEYKLLAYEEQKDFIKMFAINAETFDYEKFLRNQDTECEQKIVVPEKQGLLGTDGLPIKTPSKSNKKIITT